MSKKVGVLLSGCGFLDGAEIHESVLAMLHLDKAGAEIVCLAPNSPQLHVVDHTTGEVAEGQERNVMAEAARIARGKIQDVAEVSAEDLDALVMPGGFGAAKNLSDFASATAEATVDPGVMALIRGMLEAKKPIGAVCISPVVVAAALKDSGTAATLTIGDDADTARAIETMGAHHEACQVTGFTVDETHKIVSTPAYMFDARVSEVSQGIEKLVATVLTMA